MSYYDFHADHGQPDPIQEAAYDLADDLGCTVEEARAKILKPREQCTRRGDGYCSHPFACND